MTEMRSWPKWIVFVVPPLIAAAVFANSLFSGFVWDDIYLILQDHTIKSFQYLNVIFSSDFFGHQEDDLVYGYYRPIISLTYALDYAVWQESPFGYHLTNLILHAAATLLVSLTALVMTQGNRRVSFLTAVLFAVHPMHTENVAWISGRTDVVAFVFVLAAFLLDHRAARSRFPGLSKALAALLFLFALLSKEMAVVLVLWIAASAYFLHHKSVRQTAWSVLPYCGVLAVYLVWRFGVLDVAMPSQPTGVTLLHRLATAPWTLVRYLVWLVLPLNQSAYIQNPYIAGISDPRLYLGVGAVAAAAVGLWHVRDRLSPTVRGLGVMTAVSFLPILNLIAVSAPKDMGGAMAERFLYFPSFPFLVLIALGADHLWRHRPRARRTVWVTASLLVCILAAVSALRNRVWRNNETFYKQTLETVPSALLWCNLANHYIVTHQWRAAEDALAHAKKFFEDDYHYMAELASYHVARGEFEAALALQEKVAKKVNRGRAVAYNNLAFLYRTLGRLDPALALLDEVIDNHRAYGDVYFNLAEIYRAKKMPGRAIDNYRKALSQRPDNLQYAGALGNLLVALGRFADAAAVFERQHALHRDDPGVLNNLGVIYRKMNRIPRAERAFEAALRLNPRYAKARLNLADALLASGDAATAATHLKYLVIHHPNTAEGRAAETRLRTRSAASPK